MSVVSPIHWTKQYFLSSQPMDTTILVSLLYHSPAHTDVSGPRCTSDVFLHANLSEVVAKWSQWSVRCSLSSHVRETSH